MTVSVLHPASSNPADPFVEAFHLACLLGCGSATLSQYVRQGKVPPPDTRTFGNAKLWKLSTIQAWKPELVPDLELLIARTPVRLSLLPNAA